jgi:hypothetical protein
MSPIRLYNVGCMMVKTDVVMITGALASTTSPPYVYNSFTLYNVTRDYWMSVNTTGANFANIFRAAFFYKSLLRKS